MGARMSITANTRTLATKAKLFRGFADPSRLSILEALRRGPMSVTEIVEETGLSQPNTSNHLACLLDCGLVLREQRGRFAYYRHSDERACLLLGLADELLSEVASGVCACPRYETDTDIAAVALEGRGL